MTTTEPNPARTSPPLTQPDRAAGRIPHLAGLDGLRAIAVLLVIGYHSVPSAIVGGYLGVDVFFVISGFLITGLLLRERGTTGRIRLGRFWLGRARRLLPALGLLLVVCTVAAAIIGGDLVAGLPQQLLGAVTFSSNWVAVATGADYVAQSAPELYRTLWSLAVEEQFYLVWPFAVLALSLLPRRAARVGAVGILAAASVLAMMLVPGDPSRRYFGTDTHAFGLAMGAALAFALSGRFRSTGDRDAPTVSARLLPEPGARRPSRAALVLIDTAAAVALAGVIWMAWALAWTDPRVLGGGIAVASLLTVVVVAGATTPGSWLGAAIDVPPLRWIGQRSYGLYLWHWPVLLIVAALVGRTAAWWAVPAIAVPVAVAAAALSYRVVETPVRTLGLRGALARIAVQRPAVRASAIGLLGAGAVAALLAVGLIAADDRTTDAQVAIDRGQEVVDTMPTPAAVPPTGTPMPAPSARPWMRPPPPALATGDEISAIGDSVMLASAPELAAALPGIAIDAAVSRHMTEAEQLIADQLAAGTLRRVVVLALATNSAIDPDVLPRVLELIGPDRDLVLVTAQAPRDWIDGNNGALADFATRMRAVELADWHTAIQPRLDVLASDDVHPGPTGAAIYAQAVLDALTRFTLIPPLLDADELRWLPRAV